MKKLILVPLIGLIAMIPGDSSAYAPHRGGGGARPAPHPAPAMHAPTFHGGGRAQAGQPSIMPHLFLIQTQGRAGCDRAVDDPRL